MQREKYSSSITRCGTIWATEAEIGGTFYYENAEPVCYFWNMYDQVLLRPELLEGFRRNRCASSAKFVEFRCWKWQAG